jgi:Mn2+/Fe2+ NRAMP family transporter
MFKRIPSFLRHVGPGVITGAADDDPSGIATYTQAGAQFGTGLLWTVFLDKFSRRNHSCFCVARK